MLQYLKSIKKLGVEDDYIRLQKISEGIKQISHNLQSQKTFQSSTLIKQIICCYPFSEASIEMLLKQCFEQFQHDSKFIQAFHKALTEVAVLLEYRQFLGSRQSSFARAKGLTNNNNVTAILKEQLKQGAVPFSREVVERLIIAKRFCSQFLKQIFTTAKQMNLELEQMAVVFKLFLQHTKNELFQLEIIDIYEDLKQNAFKDEKWIEQYNQELEDFFIQNRIKVPSKLIQSKLNLVKNKNHKILKDHCERKQKLQSQTETESDSQSLSPDPLSKIIDYKTKIQLWICSKQTPIIDIESYVFFTNADNCNIILSFILNPSKIELINAWEQYFRDIQEPEKPKYYKLANKLDKLEVIRSYLTVKLICNYQNLQLIEKVISTFIEALFRKIYESLINDTINVNLNHIAYLIDKLLLFSPQKSLCQILQYNLLFTLSIYLYNKSIANLLGDILCLWIDKYKFGFYLHEQVWKYIDYTNWFNFVFQIMIKKQSRTEQCYKEYKTLKIDGILAFVKLLKSPEKTQKTGNDIPNSVTSRQEPLTPIEFSEEQQQMNTSQWILDNNSLANQLLEDYSSKDIDNLKNFSKEKTALINSSMIKEMDSSPFKLKLFQSTYSKGFETISPNKSTSNLISPKGKLHSSSVSSLPLIDNKPHKSESMDSQNCQNYLSRTRNKTYFISNDGFSTTKLISIYPRRNIDQQYTNFETAQAFFAYNTQTLKGCISLIKILIDSIFKSLIFQEKFHKDSYHKQKFLMIVERQFLTDKVLMVLFKIYLYGIINNEDKRMQKLSFECGYLINDIYAQTQLLKLVNLNTMLKECFAETADYITKKLIELNSLQLEDDYKYKQYLLFTTLVNGLTYFEQYDPNTDDKNVFKYLNETVMHILIINFFNSQQNNIYQLNFVKLIAILFSRAPSYQLQNLLFHVGLVTSLYNGYTTYNKNGCKNTDYVESLYLHLTYIIYIINVTVSHRQLNQLLHNLESSESWKGLQIGLPDIHSKQLNELNSLMRIEKPNLKRLRVSSKRTSSSKDSKRIKIELRNDTTVSQNSMINEIIKSKISTNESSPVKQQQQQQSLQVKKLIRYRTKNSLKV